MKKEERFWYQWILQYSLGEIIGIGAAGAIARVLYLEYSQLPVLQSELLTPLALVTAGAAEGLVMGFVQWKPLSKLIINSKRTPWILTTMVTYIMGWMLILPPTLVVVFFFIHLDSISNWTFFFYTFLAGSAFGGLIGMAQFLLLRKHFVRAWSWIFATAFGWGISYLLLCIVLNYNSPSFTFSIIITVFACLLSGLVQGVATGFTFHSLMKLKKQDSQLHLTTHSLLS